MQWIVVAIPAMCGVSALVLKNGGVRRALLITGAVGHLSAVIALFVADSAEADAGRWIGLDAAGLLFLTISSLLFLAVAVYSLGYLRRESGRLIRDHEEGFLFRNDPEAVFIGCLLLFLATMSLVCISRDLGLLWVAVEATTLVSSPLISFHRHHRSLEATWKYLLICSVGIAMALLGNFFLAFAGAGQVHLNLDDLLQHAGTMDPIWLKAAFMMLLVGYGTKMGLSPMHTWLPDAHSEAPSMVSTLLSGALLNCAFLGIIRGHAVLTAAGLGTFSGRLLIFFGVLSMLAAAAFLIGQLDYKRMLAYSSIEHMGILAIGLGLGGIAGKGAMLHALNHSLAKALLFLTAGQLLFAYGSKYAADIRYALKKAPLAGFLWIAGFLAIAGSPPFGLFISELTILRGALADGRWLLATVYLVALGTIFVAMARLVLPMVFGQPEHASLHPPGAAPPGEPFWFSAPAMILGALSLMLGMYIPPPVWEFLGRAAAVAGGP